MGAYWSQQETCKERPSEIIAVTRFADNIMKDLRLEIHNRDTLIGEYRRTIEELTRQLNRYKSKRH